MKPGGRNLNVLVPTAPIRKSPCMIHHHAQALHFSFCFNSLTRDESGDVHLARTDFISLGNANGENAIDQFSLSFVTLDISRQRDASHH